MAVKPVNVGIVGCGNISSAYLTKMPTFDILNVVACADLVVERAASQAAKFGVPWSGTPADLFARDDIDIVVNLTIPAAHGTVGRAALETGKSVHTEKPLSLSREEGQGLLDVARERDLRVGAAPDTFLGGGLQTCRQLLDEGVIGEPVAATAFMMGHGPESWHPDPDFFYQPGAGPLFDMGPYYLTTLISMLGPIRRVTGSARASFPERTIGSEPKKGQTITVNTPTHHAAVLDFASGPIATLVTSFDVWHHETPRIEIYGTEGTMSLPDPNIFGGPVRVRRAQDEAWEEMPLTHGHTENSRGIGVADLAHALRSGRPHRASGEMAYHVLDVMHAVLDASAEGRHIDVASTCERPTTIPVGLPPNLLDD